jgi:hypothetical protein
MTDVYEELYQDFRPRHITGIDTPRTKTFDLMVDIDDVIFPLIDQIHGIAQRRGYHDGSVGPEWDAEQYGVPVDDYWDLWREFTSSDGYMLTEPSSDALTALRRLLWSGHRIHLVTARGFMANAEMIRTWTPQWLEEYAVPHSSLTFSQNKPGAQAELGVTFDFAIDDHPKNYAALDAAGVQVYLLDHHHNRLADVERRVSSVEEWANIIIREAAA